MGYDSGYYMMGGMHGLWWLFWIVLLGVLVLNGWAHARDWRNRSGQTLRDTPHELLQRWLAGVDLTPAEYEERKSLIDRDAGPHHGKN